ncbi:TPA_asm: L protein [Psilorhabdovirus 2]|nr:TPA_asm: L protein [Psilorhabdovirus 2]
MDDLLEFTISDTAGGSIISGLEGETFPSGEERTERFLRNEDYSLDSPIILDNMENSYQKRHQSQWNGKLKEKELWALYKEVENPITPTKVHQAFFNWLVIMERDYKLKFSLDSYDIFKAYLTDVLCTPHSIQEIVNTFFANLSPLESMHGIDWDRFEQRIQSEVESDTSGLVFYWTIYQLHRYLVLLANSINNDEQGEILKVYQQIGLKTSVNYQMVEGMQFLIIDMPIIGTVYLGRNAVLLKDQQLVFDKNFLLMFQDLCSNRFCTLLLLLYPDVRYSFNLRKNVESLYSCGDKLIAQHGNPGYDAIKLLEPICNDIIKRAVETSNVVISDNGLNEYLRKECNNLCTNLGSTARDFFDNLKQISNYYDAVFVFGLFRHWGHPFIEYLEGLKKLHDNVQMPKQIDESYVNLLASDLARRIIRFHFRKAKVWPVDLEQLPNDHPFYHHVRDYTWPNRGEERRFGDHWHELPMTKVFDAPTSINLAEVLDDKSHSITLSKLKEAIRAGSIGDPNQRKVLLSTLYNKEINIPSFLKEIDQNGLSDEDLVIGLRAKERELKRIGRFFALMTLRLRIYFVITELMIANHILPLFPSLTMTSSMNKVFKKMSDCVPGHGTDFLHHVTYAEHFDYEKWNNHQRYESTAPIFSVIDKSFGFNNVITRTHEFFQKSFVYFANRPDLMVVTPEGIKNRDPSKLVCWNGQKGGLEGLRQKGWSIVSLLMIERESRNRNPRVRTLAQGDNQVVCITYLLPREKDPNIARANYIDIYRNRTYLLECIRAGAFKLGLLIKPDESWSSYNFLIYGKFALIGGNLVCSEAKRYSRINVISNDMVQSMSNALSSVVTTCLTVSQQSDTIVKPIHLFVKYGVWVARTILIYDLAGLAPIFSWDEIKSLDTGLARLLFTDSSLGGLGGSSLLRFTIRQFPDAVTEALSFWRLIHEGTSDPDVKKLAIIAGHPKIKRFELNDLLKLIESPTSLNCETGTTPTSVLKNLVRAELMTKINSIKHDTIRECLQYTSLNRDHFLTYLNSIQPRFPRFLSNFYSGTIYGFVESMVGLIQNSRTIKIMFTPKFTKVVCDRITRTERNDVRSITSNINQTYDQMWGCSATWADSLRSRSWGRVIGETVPHPAELIKLVRGDECLLDHNKKDYLTCHFSLPSPLYPQIKKGPCNPYMGSETSDLTELYHAWEKRTELVLLKKALNLRNVINWFVKPESSLHYALISNLQSLTNEQAVTLMEPGPQRAGSYIHRYSTPFQSAGGFSAVCHNKLRYVLSTTDTMSDLADTNWDFMYQSILLFGQTVLTTVSEDEIPGGIVHGHIQCQSCLRPVDIDLLETPLDPPEFHSLKLTNTLFVDRAQIPFVLDQIKLEDLPSIGLPEIQEEISLQIGNTQGFLHTLSFCYDLQLDDLGSLFAKSVFDNLNPPQYFTGLLIGIIRGTLINSMSQQFMFTKRDRVANLKGQLLANIYKLKETPDISSLISSPRFSSYLSKVSHITGAHYPLNSDEITDLLRTYLIVKSSKHFDYYINRICEIRRIVLFPETITAFVATGLVLSVLLCRGTLKIDNLTRSEIYKYKTIMMLTNTKVNESVDTLMAQLYSMDFMLVKCYADMKTVSKYERNYTIRTVGRRYEYKEYEGEGIRVPLRSNTQPVETPRHTLNHVNRYCPLISGLRLIQIQTGAHYKLKCLLRYLNVDPSHVVCGGDYSGGFSSTILRKYPNALVVFNSLLDLSKFPGGGMHPAPPSAISRLPDSLKGRCLNLHSAWEEPSDLSLPQTWDCIIGHFPKNSIDLIIIDAEVEDPKVAGMITTLIDLNAHKFHPTVNVIYKCYYSLLNSPDYPVLTILSSLFEHVSAAVTEYTGTFSSEFYLICHGLRRSSQKRYVDASSLYDLARLIPANQSVEKEFHRALKLNPVNTCKGLVAEFWVRSEVLLIGLLGGLGIAPVIGKKIEGAFEASEDFDQFFSAILFTLSYLLKELNIKVQHSFGSCDGVPVPSADWAEGFGCMILGILYYLSYILRDIRLFNSLVDKEMLIIFYKVSKSGVFSWSFEKETDTSLRCRLSRKKHLMATWIRLLECWRFEKNIKVSNICIQNVSKYLSHLVKDVEYRWFNPKFLMQYTGFLDICKLFLPFHPKCLFEHSCKDCPSKQLNQEKQEEVFHLETSHPIDPST